MVTTGGKNFASSSSSPFAPFFSSATGPWHESMARYWQIGEDLGWDAECIVGEICADMAPKNGQAVNGVVETVLHKA